MLLDLINKKGETERVPKHDHFGRPWVDVGPPLDFAPGPTIIQQSLRRDFFGLWRSPRAIFIHFRFNIKMMANVGRSWAPQNDETYTLLMIK